MAGIVTPTHQSQRFEVYRIPMPVTRAEMIETIPDGTFKSAETFGVNPAFFSRVAE